MKKSNTPKPRKQLTFSRQTVRQLATGQLAHVAGGETEGPSILTCTFFTACCG